MYSLKKFTKYSISKIFVRKVCCEQLLMADLGFMLQVYNRIFECIIASSTTTYTITSAINAYTCGEAFLLFDVNQTTKKLRLFIGTDATGYNQIGADVTFTGTFANMDNAYRFYM